MIHSQIRGDIMYLSITELSKKAQITRATIYNHMKELDQLNYTKVVNGKKLIDTEAIVYLTKNKNSFDKVIDTKSSEEAESKAIEEEHDDKILNMYLNTQNVLIEQIRNQNEIIYNLQCKNDELEKKLIEILDRFNRQDSNVYQLPPPKKNIFSRIFSSKKERLQNES